MKTYHDLKCNVYSHENLNTLIISGSTRGNKNSIRKARSHKLQKDNHENGRNTNSLILTFNKSIIPKEIKIGYYLKKVEHYILKVV